MKTHKRCPKCEQVKPRADFYQQKRGTISTRCKVCERLFVLAIYHTDKAKWRARKSAWLKKNRAHASEYERLRRQRKKGTAT